MRRVRPTVAKTPEALAEALGLSAAEAREWRVQDALLKRLKQIVRSERITHEEIARRAGTSRTRVTAILNDKLESVSSDLLIRILGALGYRVKIAVTRAGIAA
jgi:predicted XRE-type DNA-binding protein